MKQIGPQTACQVSVVWAVVLSATAAAAANVSRNNDVAVRFGVHEIVLRGDANVANPFAVDATVTFRRQTGQSAPVTVKAFFDGGDVWRARLYVSHPGGWVWSSRSTDDPLLNGQTGSFRAVDSAMRGKLRPHPANPRQWITDDGLTFLNLADTAYVLFRSPNDDVQPVDDATFRQYVQDNAARGITSLRAGGCGGYAGWSRHNAGIAPQYDRSNWCWQEDADAPRYWERFDLDRMQTTDRRLEWLLNHHPDMYVQLIMLGKTHRVGESWFEIPQEERLRTIDYLVARWSAWPQVYYLIVNDTQFTDQPANQQMVREIGRHLATIEPFGTLVSAGAKRREDNPFAGPPAEEWMTYLHLERQSDIDAAIIDYYYSPQRFNLPMHVYYGEDWYEQQAGTLNYHSTGIAHPDYYFRRLFWSVLFSGGSPTYGGRFPVLHPYSQTGQMAFLAGRHSSREPLRGLDSVRRLKRFLEQRCIDLASFAPDDELAEALPTPQPEPHGPSRAQAARRGRTELLVYLPCAAAGERGGTHQPRPDDNPEEDSRAACTLDAGLTPRVRIDLRQWTGRFEAEWLRPADGLSQTAAVVEGDDFRELTSPWQGSDAVLHLRPAAEGGLRPSDVVALRGGSPDYPESVLAAYRENLRAGMSLDANIRKTADGEIVVVHDQTTGRYCEHDWTIADRTVAELQSLDAAYRFDPAGDGTFPLRGQGFTFARLEEVLQLFARSRRPGTFTWIDTKDDEDYSFAENQQLYDRLVELLDRYNLWEEARVEVSKTCEAEALRQRDPRVRVVYWGANANDVLDALEYPHYERIGVSRKTAAAVAGRIHAAGQKLHIADKRWTSENLRAVRRYNPASLGTDDYAQMIQLLQQNEQHP